MQSNSEPTKWVYDNTEVITGRRKAPCPLQYKRSQEKLLCSGTLSQQKPAKKARPVEAESHNFR